MPPKGDSKGIMSPKSENNNVANRTRGAAGRRMSREGAESTASEHDLAQYDREHAEGSGTASSSTPPSMSSTPAANHSDITAEQRHQLDSFRQSQQQQMEVFYQSLIQPTKPAKTAKPAPAKVELVPAIPVASTSTASSGDSKSLAVDPSVARLFSGMASHLGGLPIMGSSSSGAATVTPGGVLADRTQVTRHGIGRGHDVNGDDSDEDKRDPKPSVNDLKWNHIHVFERDRVAPDAVRSVRAHYQSFQGRATVIRCRDIRNKHEVDTLSGIADAMLAGQHEIALEMVIRRMLGVEDADASGGRDWDTATYLDLVTPGTLVGDELRRRIRRETAHIKANRKKDTSARSRTSAGTGGAWKKGGRSGGSGARRGGSSGATTTRG
jgi:hypothetical protein